MATLNTLRTRGALFLSIVIGIALIAFLLGDLTSASSVFQSRRNRVGSVNGNNIDYMEFSRENDSKSQVIQSLYGRSSLSAEDHDRVRDMVWDSYIRRYSYAPGFHKLGLSVGETEQVDMVQGQYVSPVIASLFGSSETGQVDPAVIRSFVEGIDTDATGRMPAMWEYAKDEMVNERTLSKYVALVRGGAFVNDLEVARGVAAANNTYKARYALVPFSGIADSLVTVSSSEVRSYFKTHKDNFKQTASRDLEYVVFDLVPSETDYADAAAHVNELAAEFAVATDPAQYASLNSQERTDPMYYGESQLSGDALAIAFGDRRGEMAGPTLTGDIYKISRVAAERMMPDSVGARHILLPVTRAASADSIVNAIKRGASIIDLAPAYTIDQTVDLGVFPPQMMVQPFADAVIAANRGDVFKVETQFGTHVVEMTYRTPLVRKVQVATITYNVEPSAATEQAAYNKARDFLTAAAGSKENFDAAVASTGASMRVATVGERDRDVTGMTNSRELVRWSFNTKPGTVSSIFDIDGDYVVAVLTGAKEAGIADIRDAALSIVQRLRTEKKAEMIEGQIADKSIDQIAADIAGATKGELADLKFTAFYEPTIGVEPAVIGAVEGLAAGSVSKPIRGYAGVYVVAVDSVDKAEDATDESERVRLEAGVETSLAQRISQALLEETDIKDYRAKFF